MLLHFAYADFEEQQIKFEKVHQIYKKYLDIEDIDPTLVRNNPSEGLSQLMIESFFSVTFST